MQGPTRRAPVLALLSVFVVHPAAAEIFNWGRVAGETSVLRVEIVRGDRLELETLYRDLSLNRRSD